ncbi:MAG: cupin domain-containing protein [Alphaproteobacteria bacterium]|jgi:mannose-6-phosphate isomerase-like protein (cupin superfamily)
MSDPNTSDNVILKFDEIATLERGGGVASTPLVIPSVRPDAAFTTGISSFPVGQSAPLHKHNCDEQVTLLSGRAEVEIDGKTTELKAYDTTYVTAGAEHCFRNIGDEPMVILWIYGSNRVTRTFAGSDEEVPHLSDADRLVR